MRKRIFSILLICCMVLTLLPVTAAAAGESATAQGGDATFTLSASSASCRSCGRLSAKAMESRENNHGQIQHTISLYRSGL